jgi:beta-lactamase regulating signal transducer with metallopeptidase domain
MSTFTSSAFLQALGYAIANSLWQTALIWVVCMTACNLLRLTATKKYRIATIAQVIGFVWFAATFQFYYFKCTEALHSSITPLLGNNINLVIAREDGSIRSQFLNILVKGEQLLPYLAIAYLLLLSILSAKWIIGYRHTQYIKSNGLHRVNISLRSFVRNVAIQLGIKQEVKVFLSEVIKSPMTIGFLKPVILVPLASIGQLSTEQMEAVLLHELAHIKRFDYLLNILLSLIETILFFNPFTQLIGKAIKKEREDSCDDWVLQFKYRPDVYAEALLRIAYLQAAPAFAMTAVNTKNDLLSRIKRMAGKTDNRFNYKQQLLVLLLLMCITCSIAWLLPNEQHQKSEKGSKANTKKVVIEPMSLEISNPLFSPVVFLRSPLKAELEKNKQQLEKDIVLSNRNPSLPKKDKDVASLLPAVFEKIQTVNLDNLDNLDMQEGDNGNEAMKIFTKVNITDTGFFKKNFSYNFNFDNKNNEAAQKKWLEMRDLMIRKTSVELKQVLKDKSNPLLNDKKTLELKMEQLKKMFAELKGMNINFSMPEMMPNAKWFFSNDRNQVIAPHVVESTIDQQPARTPHIKLYSQENKSRIVKDSVRIIARNHLQKNLQGMQQQDMFLAMANDDIGFNDRGINPTTNTFGPLYYLKSSLDTLNIMTRCIDSCNRAMALHSKIVSSNTNSMRHYEVTVTDDENHRKKIIIEIF